jgi:hypothetical protein
MSSRFEPHAESTCRLCRLGIARVRFTEQSNVIDVSCPNCGQFRIEIPGYHIDLNGLTDEQREKLKTFVSSEQAAGDVSPLITRDRLAEIVGTSDDDSEVAPERGP